MQPPFLIGSPRTETDESDVAWDDYGIEASSPNGNKIDWANSLEVGRTR